jgi:hypothetical protein
VKTDKYHKNIHRRGNVPESTARAKQPFSVGPVMLGALARSLARSPLAPAASLSRAMCFRARCMPRHARVTRPMQRVWRVCGTTRRAGPPCALSARTYTVATWHVHCRLVRARCSFRVVPSSALGFFLFVVVGSSLLQIIKTATSGMPPA